MSNFIHDLRFAMRMSLRNPGFSLVIIAVLALGIGANTAIFSLISATLLRSLPFPEPGRLFSLSGTNKQRSDMRDGMSPANYADVRARATSFEQICALHTPGFNVRLAENNTRRVLGARVTHDFFKMLGLAPRLGRPFQTNEEGPGAPPVVILSSSFWRSLLNSDAEIIGKPLAIDGVQHTVIGVLPDSFRFPLTLDVYLPFNFDAGQMRQRMYGTLFVYGRIKSGITPGAAQAELNGIAAQLETDWPKSNAARGIAMEAVNEQMQKPVRGALIVFQAAVGFVLLIACANVANLLLARGIARRREIAIRASLGAGARRIAQQLLTESLLLSVIAGGAGLLLAYWAIDYLATETPSGLRLGQWMIDARDVELDWRVLSFAIGCAATTGILFGLAPFFSVMGIDLNTAVKNSDVAPGGGRPRGMRRVLVVGEIALASTLLAGSALLIQTFVKLSSSDPGFRTDHLLKMRIAMNSRWTPERSVAFYRETLDKIKAIPGVESAAFVNWLPFSGLERRIAFDIADRRSNPGDAKPDADFRIVTPSYLSALAIPLKRGRWLDEHDGEKSADVMVISEAMARRYWPGEDALGKHLLFDVPGRPVNAEVVGIVGDVQYGAMGQDFKPVVYASFAQWPIDLREVVVRTSPDPTTLSRPVRQAIGEVNKDVAVYLAETMERRIEQTLSEPKFSSNLMTVFAIAALTLAALGIYGVVSYSVSRRTRELAIRMALGAKETQMLRMVLGEGATLAAVGLTLGLLASLTLPKVLGSMLAGVGAMSPWILVAVASTLFGAALLATWLPARRAARVHPSAALRYE